MVDGVSFKSKINFVNAKTFDNLCCGERIVYNKFVKAKNFNTISIRNCTGSIAVDYKNKIAKGGHTYPSSAHLELAKFLLKDFFSDIKPEKGFLIGSRYLEDEQISMKIFDKFKNGFKQKVKNLTIFGGQIFPYSESDFIYDINTDTLTLCTAFKRPWETSEHFVSNMIELKECFNEIKIAKDDTLYFNDKPVDLNQYSKYGKFINKIFGYRIK